MLNDLRDTFALLHEANVNVYAFDTKGLALNRGSEQRFRLFADNTGGWAVTNRNEPWTAVAQVFRENSSYYVIGFQSTRPSPDGRFHRIKVNVNRPDMEVHARAGYVARRPERGAPVREGPRSALDDTISAAMPLRDTPITLLVAAVAAQAQRDGAAAILVGIEAPDPTEGEWEILTTAFSDDWKPRGEERQRLTLRASPPTSGTVRYDVSSRLSLKPGRYEIRVGVRQSESGRVGSAYASVTVPDFRNDPLSLSGMFLEQRSPVGARWLESIASLVPVQATTNREFRRSDVLVMFLRIYQRVRQSALTVRLLTRITDTANHLVLEDTVSLAPDRFHPSGAADYQRDVPLSTLTPGEYLLSLEAFAGQATRRRDVRFTIR